MGSVFFVSALIAHVVVLFVCLLRECLPVTCVGLWLLDVVVCARY